jgi:hypothetical protein
MIERPRTKPNPKWQSISLVMLLEDLVVHDTALTRQRYKSLYKNSVALPFADRDFNQIAGNKKATHVTSARIRRDIKAIKVACAPVERLVNKVVAHTEADRRKLGRIKYGQVDVAIDLLETTFKRYSLLVHGTICDPLVPLDEYDVRGDLKKIWV